MNARERAACSIFENAPDIYKELIEFLSCCTLEIPGEEDCKIMWTERSNNTILPVQTALHILLSPSCDIAHSGCEDKPHRPRHAFPQLIHY